MIRPILLIAVVFFMGGTISAQNLSEEYLLQTIESLYNNGQYISAELEARRLQEQPDLNDSVRVQTEKWIAFSLIAQGKSSPAKERFIALMKIDETFELDPVLTSPKILSVFNDAKVRFLSLKKTAAADSSALFTQSVLQQTPITFRAALFPGWEQLHQGRETSGWILLGAGAVTLASGIACEVLRADARSEYLNAKTSGEIASTYDRYNIYRTAEYYSFTAFALVYFVSEIDLFSHSSVTIRPIHSQNLGNQLLFSLSF